MDAEAQLKRAIESQHGCTATLAQSVPLKETSDGATVSAIRHIKKLAPPT